MSHPLLIFLFLKAFIRVTSLFQIYIFFLLVWCCGWKIGFVNHKFTGVFFCREIFDFSENIDSCCDGNLLIGFFFFNRVGRVNLEYQPSHLSLTDSRPSLGINLYMVSDSSWSALRRIRLSRVVIDSANFLNPTRNNIRISRSTPITKKILVIKFWKGKKKEIEITSNMKLLGTAPILPLLLINLS